MHFGFKKPSSLALFLYYASSRSWEVSLNYVSLTLLVSTFCCESPWFVVIVNMSGGASMWIYILTQIFSFSFHICVILLSDNDVVFLQINVPFYLICLKQICNV
jgi:hypothetical protein